MTESGCRETVQAVAGEPDIAFGRLDNFTYILLDIDTQEARDGRLRNDV